MTCMYFKDDYVGFCSATVLQHVPTISEMERLCFKDYRECCFYNIRENIEMAVQSEPVT